VAIGDTLHVNVTVHNVGTAPASDVTVTVPLPANLTYQSEWTDLDWTCTFSATTPGWQCLHGPLAPGGYATTFAVTATVTSGAPGTTFPVLVEAATSPPDASAANDTSRTTVTIA